MAKPRKCPCGCGKPALMGNGVTVWASYECAVRIADKRLAKKSEYALKEARKQKREAKAAMRPLQYWLKRTQKAVNDYVRARDLKAGHGCITCGTHDAEEWHAGHWISVGASSATRFDTTNIHLQCRQCNYFGAGRAQDFEARLPARIGQSEVDRLKNAKRKYLWTREECQEMEAEYKLKLKEIEDAS